MDLETSIIDNFSIEEDLLSTQPEEKRVGKAR